LRQFTGIAPYFVGVAAEFLRFVEFPKISLELSLRKYLVAILAIRLFWRVTPDGSMAWPWTLFQND
jgi:hypothetical protein